MRRILSLDIGDRRIGVAMSDTLGILATPLTILDRKGDETAIASIIDLVNKHDAGQIIAGLPRSLSGGIGPQAEKVQSFVEKLKQQTDVPVDLRDERFTTVDAQRLMREAATKKKKGKMQDDAAAAAVLLQAYLDEKSLERH